MKNIITLIALLTIVSFTARAQTSESLVNDELGSNTLLQLYLEANPKENERLSGLIQNKKYSSAKLAINQMNRNLKVRKRRLKQQFEQATALYGLTQSDYERIFEKHPELAKEKGLPSIDELIVMPYVEMSRAKIKAAATLNNEIYGGMDTCYKSAPTVITCHDGSYIKQSNKAGPSVDDLNRNIEGNGPTIHRGSKPGILDQKGY